MQQSLGERVLFYALAAMMFVFMIVIIDSDAISPYVAIFPAAVAYFCYQKARKRPDHRRR